MFFNKFIHEKQTGNAYSLYGRGFAPVTSFLVMAARRSRTYSKVTSVEPLQVLIALTHLELSALHDTKRLRSSKCYIMFRGILAPDFILVNTH